jgi:hypothetical protein
MIHLNDANLLVAATCSKPLNNFDHVRNLPAMNRQNPMNIFLVFDFTIVYAVFVFHD